MNNIDNMFNKTLGFKGEKAVIDKLKTVGFVLYKQNIKKNNAEIDVVVYKYNHIKNSLDIRVIEVKTRTRYDFDLINFNISKKWNTIRPYLFNIKSEVGEMFDSLSYSEIHFDLALVKNTKDYFSIYSYIKDVNLII